MTRISVVIGGRYSKIRSLMVRCTRENLFRPFQRGAESTGLGLYMSRAIMRSFGGELLYEPRERGCCFAIVLHAYAPVEESVNA